MEYTCIFDPKQKCPVKTEYKLKPESLVEFCKICRGRSEEKMVFEFFTRSLAQMGELQHKIGQKTAEAELYKKLYEDSTIVSRLTHLKKLKDSVKDLKGVDEKDGDAHASMDVSMALLRRTNYKWICSKCGKEIAAFPDSMKCPHCKSAFQRVQYESAVK